MPVITMNVPCTLASRTGSDVYGQPVLGKPRPIKCAVLKFELKRVKTTIRSDASGTRGHADESTAQIAILVAKDTVVELDDILELRGVGSRVSCVRPRYNVMGRLDHYEVEALIE